MEVRKCTSKSTTLNGRNGYFVAETKDKLKVVVTSTLVTDLGREREEENLEMTPRTGTAITVKSSM